MAEEKEKAKVFIQAKKLAKFKEAVGETEAKGQVTYSENETAYDNSIAFIEDTNQLWAKKHYYSFVPNGGKPGQFLTYESPGKAAWTDMDLAMLHAYGVEWDETKSDPVLTRVGNPLLHQQLPIQNGYRGCIAQGTKVMYYLDPNDWNHREFDWEVKVTTVTETTTLGEIKDSPDQQNGTAQAAATEETGKYLDCILTQENDVNSIFRHAFVTVHSKCHGVVCNVDKTAYKITIKLDTTESGFCINPNGDTSESDTSNTHTEIKSIFIGSNLSGCDGAVKIHTPRFYGRGWDIVDTVATADAEAKPTKHRVMISTDKIDATWNEIPEMLVDAYRVSLLNKNVYNRGYLDTLQANTAISCMNDEEYMKGNNGNKQDQKGDDELTKKARSANNKPYTNKSRSDMRGYVKNADAHLMNYEEYKWIFYWNYVIEYANFNSQAEYKQNLENGLHQGGMGDGITTDTWAHWTTFNGNNPLCPNGYLNEFGNGTGQKEFKIKFPTNGDNTTAEKTFKAFRWRGFDNAFGDIWTNIDGCLVCGTNGSGGTNPTQEGEQPTFYIIPDPNNYTDEQKGIETKAVRWFKMPDKNGWIKSWWVGQDADMIPKELTTSSDENNNGKIYTCDYYWIIANSEQEYPRRFVVGGGVNHGASAGLGAFDCNDHVALPGALVGFRSVSGLGLITQGLRDKWYYIEPEKEEE